MHTLRACVKNLVWMCAVKQQKVHGKIAFMSEIILLLNTCIGKILVDQPKIYLDIALKIPLIARYSLQRRDAFSSYQSV